MNEDTHSAKGGHTVLTPVSSEEAAVLQRHGVSKVLQPASEHGLTDVQLIGFGHIASTPQVVTREQGDWLILPTELDPLYQQAKLAAPLKVRARIRELVNAGVWFDALAIAHQVPPGALAHVQNGEELQLLLDPPMPKSLTVLSTVVSSIVTGTWRIGELVGDLMARALDPMIIGAVVATPPAMPGDAALFFLVTSWDY